MSESAARNVLLGIDPMPEDMTVEQVFLDSHIIIHVVTPF